MNKLILFLLIFALTLLSLFTHIITNRNNNDVKNEQYKGVIIKKEVDNDNRGMTYLHIINNTSDTTLISTIDWNNLWLYTEIGDSLIKKTNTFTIIIKKQNNIIKTVKYDTNLGDAFYIFLGWIIILILIFSVKIIKEKNTKTV